MTPSIQIVLVLYRTALSGSAAFSSFMKYRHLLSVRTSLFIYNNSPEIKIETAHDGSYEVFNASQNDMLAKAYNRALECAEKNGCEWLMPLDQDTELNENFLTRLNSAIIDSTADRIAAILPTFVRNGKTISPLSYRPKLSSHWLCTPATVGINSSCLSAFNSCATLNVEAIKAIGGFPEEYPLDDLDLCYLYRLYKRGYRFIIIDARLRQELSIHDYKRHMTHERYEKIMDADLRFAREIGPTAVFMWKIRMILRCIKTITNNERRKYIRTTLSYIFCK